MVSKKCAPIKNEKRQTRARIAAAAASTVETKQIEDKDRREECNVSHHMIRRGK